MDQKTADFIRRQREFGIRETADVDRVEAKLRDFCRDPANASVVDQMTVMLGQMVKHDRLAVRLVGDLARAAMLRASISAFHQVLDEIEEREGD